jgi:hypothetical protein
MFDARSRLAVAFRDTPFAPWFSPGGGPSDRKLRLFAVAACRRRVRIDERVARILRVCEADADGTAGWDDLTAAWKEVGRELKRMKGWGGASREALRQAEAASQRSAAAAALALVDAGTSFELLFCLFGDPTRPRTAKPSWLAWSGGLVGRLAKVIWDGRTFEDLPILADALEEAGCDDACVLSHCRQAGGHALGCWVLDLVLGRE